MNEQHQHETLRLNWIWAPNFINIQQSSENDLQARNHILELRISSSLPTNCETSMNRIAPASTVDRYFTLHYAPGLARQAFAKSSALFEDVCIARHHNGLCLLCLSPRHPIVASQIPVTSVDYRVEMKQVTGKRKKGGIVVEERTKLCTLACENGEAYVVQCAVKGTLIEYNEALRDYPSLVARKPLSEGYLAAVLPWASKIKTAADHLMPADEYDRKCRESENR